MEKKMNKYCIVGEIKPECVDDYIKFHEEIHKGVHKELLNIIKESGVKEEAVFMYKNLAIIYFEAEDLDKCYEFQNKFETTKKWDALMKPLFVSNYEFSTSKKIPVLRKVFDLNEQLKGKLNP